MSLYRRDQSWMNLILRNLLFWQRSSGMLRHVHLSTFLGAFVKLRKTTIRFVVHLSLRPNGTAGLPMGGFTWNLGISRKYIEKIQVSFKSDMVKGIDMKFFKRRAEYALFDHKRNDEILEEVEVVPADEKLWRYKSNWLRHFLMFCWPCTSV